MAPPRSSLNAYVPWPALAEVLDLPLDNQALPITTLCPACNESTLTVYEDSTSGGAWHHCFNCDQSGDLIELASNAWDISPKAALIRLVEQGFSFPPAKVTDDRVDKYIEEYVQRRKETNEIWASARKYVLTGNTPSLNFLKTHFRLNPFLSQQRMSEGPARLFGALPRKMVEAFCDKSNTYCKKLFRGRGWKDVLVIPFYDLPDRICGFEFVGRGGGTEDRVLRTVNQGHLNRHQREMGLAGLPLAQLKTSVLGNTVIAVPDTLLMLRFQMRQFNTSLTPLPIVTWHDDPKQSTKNAWVSLHDRKVVFWTLKPDAAVLSQAIKLDAWISTVGPEPGSTWTDWHNYLSEHSALDLARMIDRSATPWREALSKVGESWNDGAVAKLLNGLEERGHDVHSIADECLAGTQVSVKIKGVRHTNMFGSAYIEREGTGWFCRYSKSSVEKLIMNAILRLEEIVTGTETYYCGKIIHQGKEYPFVERLKVVEKNTALWMKELLLRRRACLFSCAWEGTVSARKIIPLAAQFHEPKIVAEEDRPEIGRAVLSMICRSVETGKPYDMLHVEPTSETEQNLVARLMAQCHIAGLIKFSKSPRERSMRNPRYGCIPIYFAGTDILVDERGFRGMLKRIKAPYVPAPSNCWPIKVPRKDFLTELDKLPAVEAEIG